MALFFNRKILSDDDARSFEAAVNDHNYTLISQCRQLFIMERDFDESQALLADNAVGIIAAEVQISSNTESEIFPKRIASLNAVLTFVDEAQLPAVQGHRTNVFVIDWGNARRKVFESLWDCAFCHSQRRGKRRSKRHAGVAQGIIGREISALASSV